jgi:hypothetical protein
VGLFPATASHHVFACRQLKRHTTLEGQTNITFNINTHGNVVAGIDPSLITAVPQVETERDQASSSSDETEPGKLSGDSDKNSFPAPPSYGVHQSESTGYEGRDRGNFF